MQGNARLQILFPATVYSIRHLKLQRTLLRHETPMMRESGIIIFDIQKHLQSMHKTEKLVKMARMLETLENILIRSSNSLIRFINYNSLIHFWLFRLHKYTGEKNASSNGIFLLFTCMCICVITLFLGINIYQFTNCN